MSQKSIGWSTVEHELALAIQGATREAYEFAMNEAHALLELSGNEPTCWARHMDFRCALRLGPHPGWMHFDGDSKTWWNQSRSFPYGEQEPDEAGAGNQEHAVAGGLKGEPEGRVGT